MELVDTVRYPLGDLHSRRGQTFVDDCAAVFARCGALVLPGFLTGQAIDAIASEAASLIGKAYVCQSEHNVFLDTESSTDRQTRMLRTRVGSIANDFLDPRGALQQLYAWPPLTRFIGAVLGYESFHRGEDPLGALSINVYNQDDLHEWHFDEARFSVTIMIQQADHGGHFEYVDGLRSDNSVDTAGIEQVLDGDETQVRRLPFTTGSLSIFGGRNTLHRVTEVQGDTPRLVPVLTYDTAPGSVNTDAVRELFWGRTG